MIVRPLYPQLLPKLPPNVGTVKECHFETQASAAKGTRGSHATTRSCRSLCTTEKWALTRDNTLEIRPDLSKCLT
jgi:hypothetical protein